MQATPTPDTHGPPAGPPAVSTDPAAMAEMFGGRALDDDAVLIRRRPVDPWNVVGLTARRADLTSSPVYRLLARALHDDPMEVVKDMTQGRYRYKRHRNRHLVIDAIGAAVPETMSFRQCAAELYRVTGEQVTHETLRRWWIKIWPDSEPGYTASRVGVIRPGPSQDAAAVDLAHAEAAAGQTNTDVPPAAFLPPST